MTPTLDEILKEIESKAGKVRQLFPLEVITGDVGQRLSPGSPLMLNTGGSWIVSQNLRSGITTRELAFDLMACPDLTLRLCKALRKAEEALSLYAGNNWGEHPNSTTMCLMDLGREARLAQADISRIMQGK